MEDQYTPELDERKTIGYRFRSIDSSGNVELNEATIYCKVTICRGTWEHEVPLSIVSPFPTRFISTPGVVWLIVGLALFAMTFGVLSLIDREMGMMNPITATALVIICLILIAFAWYHRRVVWIMFPTDSNNYRIQFCNLGPDAAKFEEFVEMFVRRIKLHRRSSADELSDARETSAQSVLNSTSTPRSP